MSFTLTAKKLDLSSGGEYVVLLHEDTAENFGVHPGDHIILSKEKNHEFLCVVNTTKDDVNSKHIGLYEEVAQKYDIDSGDPILITLSTTPLSVEYIRKKIKKHELNYEEIEEILKDIVSGKLGVIEKTYFLSTIYNPGYNDEELYSLTKAMAATGEILHFDGIVADKHSIGGVAGKGITPLVVAIVSSFGVTMPNTSTRSITTPAGTTDILETAMKVNFTTKEVKDMIEKNHSCMVWGGGLNIAPADDELIRIERPLGIESFDKFLVSIIAKKIATGVNKLVLDIPMGEGTKISNPEDAKVLGDKFVTLGAKFGIDIQVHTREVKGIDGNAIGPVLEMREVLYIFENSPEKSKQLEQEAILLAGMLLEMCSIASVGNGYQMAQESLSNGNALTAFKRISQIQGGREDIHSSQFVPAQHSLRFMASIEGRINGIKNKDMIALARILGCPLDKAAGIYLHKTIGDQAVKGQPMFSIYASNEERLQLGLTYIQSHNLFEIV